MNPESCPPCDCASPFAELIASAADIGWPTAFLFVGLAFALAWAVRGLFSAV